MTRLEAAIRRLPNVPADLIERMLTRDLAACERAVALCQAVWTDSDESVPSLDEYRHLAGPCLLALWSAREYESLARAGAPQEGAWPCSCSDGKFYAGGAVVNGVYTGKVGPCYRCGGKAWQNDNDRKRNACYDRNRRIYA